MTNIIKEYGIRDFFKGDPRNDVKLHINIKKQNVNSNSNEEQFMDVNNDAYYELRVEDCAHHIIVASISDFVLMELGQAISDLTNGMFTPSKT